MNKKLFRLSPGAPSLVLIVVVLSMSIMGMLMFVRTNSDMRLTQRSVQVAAQDAVLFARAEETLSELDALALSCKQQAGDGESYLQLLAASLPNEMAMEENVIYWQETDGSRTFRAGAAVAAYEEENRLSWHTRVLEAQVGETWNIF